jgi:3alpha(or 20beta)-hydroxysteroid dehydrogenase
MARLDGRVAIVTGAARGTGAVTAGLLVDEGARVVLADVLDNEGEKVAKQQRAVEHALARFGSLDVLVNNAAVLHMAAIDETPLADFQRVINVNQVGPFLGIKWVTAPMRKAGRGSIVNVSSIDGLQGHNGCVAYCASKWAVRGITRVAALELGRFGIRVNCVCPAGGGPEMIRPFVPEGIDVELIASYDVRRLASQKGRSIDERLEDVAKMIVFLASDDAASCTGADFPVESGNTAGAITKGAPGA